MRSLLHRAATGEAELLYLLMAFDEMMSSTRALGGRGFGQNWGHEIGCFPQLCFHYDFEHAKQKHCFHANENASRNCVFSGCVFPATSCNTPSHGFCSVGGSTRARDNMIPRAILDIWLKASFKYYFVVSPTRA